MAEQAEKKKIIQVRVTEDQHRAFVEASEHQALSLSAWLRMLATDEARRVLANPNYLQR